MLYHNAFFCVLLYYLNSILLILSIKFLYSENVLFITTVSLILQSLVCSVFLGEKPMLEEKNLGVILSNSMYINFSNLAVNFSKGFVYSICKSFTPFFVDIFTLNFNVGNIAKTLTLCILFALSFINFKSIGDYNYIGILLSLCTVIFSAIKLIFIKERSQYIQIDFVEVFPKKQIRIIKDTSFFMSTFSLVFLLISLYFNKPPVLNSDMYFIIPITLLGILESLTKFYMSEILTIQNFSYLYTLRDIIFSIFSFFIFHEREDMLWYNYMSIFLAFFVILIRHK